MSDNSTNKDKILKAIEFGYHAIAATGNVKDYIIDGDRIPYRPVYIADQLQNRGYVVLTYSRSRGLNIHEYNSIPPNARNEIDSRIRAFGLETLIKHERQINIAEEIIQVFRGVTTLLNSKYSKGPSVAVIFDYTEHLASNTPAGGSDDELFAAESIHHLAVGPSLRKTNNLLICLLRDGLQNSLLNDLYKVDYNFPNESETGALAKLLSERMDDEGNNIYALLGSDLNYESFGRITRGIRLRDIVEMMLEHARKKEFITRSHIITQKAQSVANISEGTLAVVKSNLTIKDIVGLDVPKSAFKNFAEKLKAGDPSSPRALLLAGPAGTAKSTFADLLGNLCGFNVLEFQAIKNALVGESERRMTKALRLSEDMQPAILKIDEITEMIPARSNANNDSGVSSNLLGQLLQFIAQEHLRGKVLIVAATNVPENLDPAMLDRFEILPFLIPHRDEIPFLFSAFEKRILGSQNLDPQSPFLQEASEIIYQSMASPRKIYDIVNFAILYSENDHLNEQDILKACHEFTGESNPYSVAYASLMAISYTSFKKYYPWSLSKDLSSYTFPFYLQGVVLPDGSIDRQELGKKIKEIKPFAKW